MNGKPIEKAFYCPLFEEFSADLLYLCTSINVLNYMNTAT